MVPYGRTAGWHWGGSVITTVKLANVYSWTNILHYIQPYMVTWLGQSPRGWHQKENKISLCFHKSCQQKLLTHWLSSRQRFPFLQLVSQLGVSSSARPVSAWQSPWPLARLLQGSWCFCPLPGQRGLSHPPYHPSDLTPVAPIHLPLALYWQLPGKKIWVGWGECMHQFCPWLWTSWKWIKPHGMISGLVRRGFMREFWKQQLAFNNTIQTSLEKLLLCCLEDSRNCN